MTATTLNPPDTTPAASPTATRIVAIDALRGFDMFWIAGGRELLLAFVTIFKNPPPDWLAHQFEHTKWIGFTAWDLIMPLFLFVVGAAMPFSFARRQEEGHSKRQLYFKIIRRAIILFVIGMAVQGHLLDFNLATLHPFANTLQAIAVGYLIAGIVMLNVGIIGQAIFTAAMLLGFWALLMNIPLPPHDPDPLEPPTMSKPKSADDVLRTGSLAPHSNVALAVDQFVLGEFIDGTNPPYTWILSGMTFTATVFLGVFSGHVLRSSRSPWARVADLTLLGISCLILGYLWAEGFKFPIIKHIWTSSMVLWAGGWSYLLLGLFYLLIDVLGFRRWALPFVVIGSNAIIIYVIWDFVNPFPMMSKTIFGGLASHLGSVGPFLLALAAVAMWWILLYDLYRRKIYLRL